jgi:glycosyltransferase involved in cell wall biosynthesis
MTSVEAIAPRIEEGRALVSILVPAFNEEVGIREMHKKLSAVLDVLPVRTEILFVNDGSTDGTLAALESIRASDPRVAVLDLSRNYGKEVAMTAGLDHARGDAIIIMDADLQHPPELLPEFIKYWRDGYDVVYAERVTRDDESALKKLFSNLFYSLLGRISEIQIPKHAGDFRLLSRRAAQAVGGLREHHRFMKGLFAWIGYRQKAVPYYPDARFAGTTKWSFWRLWNFAIEGMTSFSTGPLKIATYLGSVVACFAMLYGAFIIALKIFFGNPVPGYPSLMVVILFLGGVQLVFIGIIGEYVGRIFNETKNRPLYFVNTHLPARSARDASASQDVGFKR